MINDLASADGGVGFRLLVIGSPGHSHALNAVTSMPGSFALPLVLVMVIQFGHERRQTFHHWTKALPPRAAWHQ
jgi:hypothetical protein